MGQKPLPRGEFSRALGQAIEARITSPKIRLAEAVNVSEDTLSRWLKGVRAMNVDNLFAIAKALNCKAYELAQDAQKIIDEARSKGDELAERRSAKVGKSSAVRQPRKSRAAAQDEKRKPQTRDQIKDT